MTGPRPLQIATSYDVAFTGDGRFLATIGRDVSLWDLASRKKAWRVHPFSHPSHLAFSPDSLRLAVKSTSGRIVILETATGDVLTDCRNDREGEGTALHFSPDGDMLVDGSWLGCLRARDAGTGEVGFARAFPGVMLTAVHPLGDRKSWVVLHSPTATTHDMPPDPEYLTVWQWPLGQSGPSLLELGLDRVVACAPSPQGEHLAIFHGRGEAELRVIKLSDGSSVAATGSSEVGGTGGAVCWSPDGRLLACAQRGKVVIYRAPNLVEQSVLEFPYPSTVAFSPDGSLLAVGDWESGLVMPSEQLRA